MEIMRTKMLSTLALGLVMAGCNTGTTTTETVTGNPEAETTKLKVALLTPGSISDAGWSAMAYEGLKAIETDMNAEVTNEEATGSKIKESLRSYAQDGYNLIFGHGFEYNGPMLSVAKDFPKTVFVSSSGGGTAENVGAFRFYLEQGCYLAGMMAAMMSKSHKVATVGLGGIPSITSTLKAFEAGAKAIDNTTEVINVELSSDKDIAGAKRATLSALDQGADFVIHQANAAAQGVFDACKERNAYAFGTNLNQNDNPSNAVIASAVIVAKPAFLDLAKRVKAGNYRGGIELYGMQQGAIEFVINPKLQDKIPADVMKKLEGAKASINDGQLEVPKDNF